MPRPVPPFPETDLQDILRQVLAVFALPVPVLEVWLDRLEVRR